jgi:hypothetical protein
MLISFPNRSLTPKESTMAWTPGTWLINKTYEKGQGGPYQIDLAAQSSPYTLTIYWGGRSKSDTGAKGGAYLMFRNLDDPDAKDVQIGFAPTKREFPNNEGKKEDWIVEGALPHHVVDGGKSVRLTCQWKVTNEKTENVFLRVRFDGYV